MFEGAPIRGIFFVYKKWCTANSRNFYYFGNMIFRGAILFSLCAVFMACGDNDSSSEEIYPQEPPASDSTEKDETDSTEADLVLDSLDGYEGYILIHSKGKSTILGTKAKEANIDEQPSMKVTFDYDFFIGRHEVTRGEFGNLMHRSFKKDSSEYPQANVTYYDAILYANALSRHYGLDTVYTYGSAKFSEDKSCENLEGLKTSYDIFGFRLPTEAEWMFVADLYKSGNQSKTASHSLSVCSFSKDEKKQDVCDMDGNLKEWVNDWKGAFRDTTVNNYVGASSANGMNEAVLKGSSFVMNAVPLYSRGDFYTVTPISKADYVGFRLVLGKIKKPIWLNYSGKAVASTIVPLIQAEKIHSLFGTYTAKLVFRNDETGNLAYINYANAANAVIEISDNIDSYHPDISPDGKYVAFCTGLEGVSGKSRLYVRELNESGSGLVKLDVDGAAIPRWQVLENGDTVINYVSNAGNNKKDSDFKAASTWQVKFKDGKFGTPKKLFGGAYHDGISEDYRLAVTGARLLRARIAEKSSTILDKAHDTIWYNNEQACNASLSKDGSKRTLFLDFGGKSGQEFVGKNYGVHETLLIADSTGKLIQYVTSPTGYIFDHCEWISDKNMAVATLANANGSHQSIVIVDIKSKEVLKIADGTELWHPCLWVKQKSSAAASNSSSKTENSSSSNTAIEFSSANESSSSSGVQSSSSKNDSSSSVSSSTSITESSSGTHIIPYVIDEDSAGIYLNSTYNVGYGIIRSNMELLWKYYDKANVVILGSSRPLDGIAPKFFNERFFALNFANTPNNLYASKFYLDNYVYPHIKNLRYIILSIDYDLWRYSESSKNNFFYSDYKKFPGYIYDRNHNYWADGIPEDLAQATEDGYRDANTQSLVENMGHWSSAECNGWGSSVCGYDATAFDTNPALLSGAMNTLVDIIETANKRNIYVVGVIFPVSPKYKQSDIFACYGTRRNTADSLTKVLTAMQEKYPHFILMDENKMGDHDYTDSMAADHQHLCPAGAVQMTHRIDSLLLKLDVP